jgi:hypothetical protein
VFAADLDTCPRCSGPMRWVEAAATREHALVLLGRLGARASAAASPTLDATGAARAGFQAHLFLAGGSPSPSRSISSSS